MADKADVNRRVFVVHGRDEAFRRDMFAFLRALDLKPIEWEAAVAVTGRTGPTLNEVVSTLIDPSQARAVIVLLTPDDIVHLHPDLHEAGESLDETAPTGQARPNVLIELGIALARFRDATLIVRTGKVRRITDLDGINTIDFDGSASKRTKIWQRLQNAGCAVNVDGTDWLDEHLFADPATYGRRPTDPEDGHVPTPGADAAPGGRPDNVPRPSPPSGQVFPGPVTRIGTISGGDNSGGNVGREKHEMSEGSTLIDRCVIGVDVDVQAYSQRNPRRQADTQRDLQQLLLEGADAAGLDRSAWELFHTGDGELVVLPAQLDLLPVVADFVPALHSRLLLCNSERATTTKSRLRMALHIGTPSTPGNYTGTALVTVRRLLDSVQLRDALRQADQAELAVILSSPAYEKVVLSELVALTDADFIPVLVDLPAKKFTETGYVHVPGYDMRTFPRAQSPSAPDEAAERGGVGSGGETTSPDDESSTTLPGVPPSPSERGAQTSSVFANAVIHGGIHNSGTIAGRDAHNHR